MRDRLIIDAEFAIVSPAPQPVRPRLFAPWWRYFTLTRDELFTFRIVKLGVRWFVWSLIAFVVLVWAAAYTWDWIGHRLGVLH